MAKYNHKGCVVNFFGDIITPAFEFANNSHGVNFFISKITKAAKDSGAKKIFVGLEATGHYHQNLTLRFWDKDDTIFSDRWGKDSAYL